MQIADQSDAPPKIPAHQHVYETLRRNILFGDYAPGQALTIQGLVADTGAGMTPVREAIRRLTTEGALSMLSNRRLTVPVLAALDAEQLLFLRQTLEPELARRAASLIEEDHISALEQIDIRLNTAIAQGNIYGYLRENHAFHRRLYAIAYAPTIAETVDRLWLRFGPAMRVICGRSGTLNLPDRHVDILAALRAKDPAAAAAATHSDVTQGMSQILASADSIDSP